MEEQLLKSLHRIKYVDFFSAPGECTFYWVKVPNPPGSGKGIAEHQGSPLRAGI